MRKLGFAAAVVALVVGFIAVLGGVAEPPNSEGKIVFYSERDGNAEIYVMNPDGSGQTRLTFNASNEFCPDWSPDGTQIAFESDRDDARPLACFPRCVSKLYVMNADGTGERRLMDLPGTEGHPDWSPDGQSIAFQSDRNADGKNEIYAVPLDGGEPRLVIGDAFDNTAPDWSPDGQQIAFSSTRDGGLDLFVVNADGTGLREVIDTGKNDYFPDWSPDGTEILFFAAIWPSLRQDIYIVDADGANLQQLTNTPRAAEESAQWSPDGARIVYQTDRDGNFEIYSMKSDGTDVVRLTQNTVPDYWPDLWLPMEVVDANASTDAADAAASAESGTPAEASASGTEASALATAAAERQAVAFVSTRSGRAQIYTMNADGSDPVRLTSDSYDDYYPAWSPDRTQIAYYVHYSWQSWAIIVMNADGSGRRQITDGVGCAACAFAPYWSPDGTEIGFTIEPNPRPTCEIKSTEIGVVGVDGTGCRRLTDNAVNDLFYGWSPDGSSILFVSNRDGRDQVYVMNADLSNVRRQTDTGSTNNMPAWSPDGSKIAFVSNRDGNDEIYVADVDGSDVTRITSNPAHDWMPAWSADGMEILFSSDRDGSQLDVYAVRLDDLTVRRLTTAAGYDYESTWRK